MTDTLPPEKRFHVYEGPSLGSLLELYEYLPRMSQEQYRHHAHLLRNDFAAWIRFSLGEGELAKRVHHCKTKEELMILLSGTLRPPEPAGKLPTVERNKQASEAAKPLLDAAALQDDTVFTQLRDDIVARNESLGAKYDEITRRLKEALKDTTPKDLEQLADRLKSRYDELLQKLSEARRAGRDVLVPTLVARQFLAKLALAKATRNEEDFKRAGAVLDETARELDEAMKAEQVDVRKEVDALAHVGKPQAKERA